MPQDRAEKVRELDEALFRALSAVAAAHSITLPERGTPLDIERAFAALVGRGDSRTIHVSAFPRHPNPCITIAHAWPQDKRHLIEEVASLLNQAESLTAQIAGHELIICHREKGGA